MIVTKAAREHRRWRRASPAAEGNRIRRLMTNKKGEGVMIAPRMAAAGRLTAGVSGEGRRRKGRCSSREGKMLVEGQ
jgi:hypothetical protein